MNAIDQIIRDEGFQGKPYKDSVGKLTIAYGINLDDAPLVPFEGRLIAEYRVGLIEDELGATLPWFSSLDDARKAVLVNMAYNMGLATLMTFKKTLSYIEAGAYTAAGDEMLNSKWAEQVGARAQRLAEQMRTGEWK